MTIATARHLSMISFMCFLSAAWPQSRSSRVVSFQPSPVNGRDRHRLLQELIDVLNRRIKPGMKKPEGMRCVGNDHDVGSDAERLELGAHLFALLEWTIGAAVNKEHGRALPAHVRDW